MPNWGEVLQEIQQAIGKEVGLLNQANQEVVKHQLLAQPQNCVNLVKQGYLAKLHERRTKCDCLLFGFLSKPGIKELK